MGRLPLPQSASGRTNRDEQQQQQQEDGTPNATATTSTASSALSGAIAGGMSRLVTAPFDVVKIRLQLQVGPIAKATERRRLPYSSVWGALRKVAREEGVLGLWRGNLAATYLWVGYAAVQFPVYEALKKKGESGGPGGAFWAGGIAGLVATVATYPLDVIRTQFAAQGLPRAHETMASFVRHTLQTQGPRGLFAGLTPTTLQIVPRMGLSFSVFEELEARGEGALARLLEHRRRPGQERGQDYAWLEEAALWCLHALCGGLAGGVARTATHPLDTVKRRMQAQVLVVSAASSSAAAATSSNGVNTKGAFPHAAACLAHIVRHEGVAALYKGLAPTLLKAVSSSAVIFACYEGLKGKL